MRTAVAAKKGTVRRCSILGQQIMSSVQVLPALLDVVDQAAHAAQPGLVGVAADIDRLDVRGLVRGCVAHLDIDIEDQVAHLLHPAPCALPRSSTRYMPRRSSSFASSAVISAIR